MLLLHIFSPQLFLPLTHVPLAIAILLVHLPKRYWNYYIQSN